VGIVRGRGAEQTGADRRWEPVKWFVYMAFGWVS
jgi:hypothetical protein